VHTKYCTLLGCIIVTNICNIAIAINELSMLLIVFMALLFIILWLHVTIMNKVTGVV
jgi:hypothetical protein